MHAGLIRQSIEKAYDWHGTAIEVPATVYHRSEDTHGEVASESETVAGHLAGGPDRGTFPPGWYDRRRDRRVAGRSSPRLAVRPARPQARKSDCQIGDLPPLWTGRRTP